MKFTLFVLAILPFALSAQQPCPGFPACLYQPSPEFERTEPQVLRFTYPDAAGLDRRVEIALRSPIGKPGPLPVIVWAHGGGDGVEEYGSSPSKLVTWSERGAEAGYLSVTPSFFDRTQEEHDALCAALSFAPGAECDGFPHLSWDRPLDIRAILNKLEELNSADTPLQGRIDFERIGVAGHSAGSSGAITVGGASRTFANRRVGPDTLADPRPKAIVALSCAAPGSHNLFDSSFNDPSTSWDTIDRPTLFATGSGDGHELFPTGRRLAFDLSPAGHKYRFYLKANSIGHGAFGDHMDTCDNTVSDRECAAFRAAIVSTVFSFLDAYVLRKPEAIDYLANEHIVTLGQGLIEWSKK